jgi:hypothetical protein
LEGLELFFLIAPDFGHFLRNHSIPLHMPMEDILCGSLRTPWDSDTGEPLDSPRTPPTPSDYGLAHNLAALVNRSTDVIPFYTIPFSPSDHLTSLCLGQIVITLEHFRGLTDQCRKHLKHIELSLVQLHSGGTWNAVLTQLTQLPHLIDVSIAE